MSDDSDPKPPVEQNKPVVRPKQQIVPASGQAHHVPRPGPQTAKVTMSSQSPLGIQEHFNALVQLPATLQLGIQCAGRTEILVIDINAERTHVKLMEVRTS